MFENLGNPSSTALLVVSVAVLALTVGAYRGSRKIASELEPDGGGRLARIIAGVVLGILVAQLISVLNISAVIVTDNPIHGWIRLLQQLVIAGVAIWAWYRIRRLV